MNLWTREYFFLFVVLEIFEIILGILVSISVSRKALIVSQSETAPYF